MSTPITVLVELAVADGKADAFVEISRRGLEIVRSNEPGTLSFSQYFNDDRSVAISLETYADSDALLAHMKNASADIRLVEDIATVVRTEIFGNVSDNVKSTFEAFSARIYQPISEYAR
ncbi:MAG: antibiotic biosynthesis monooxygenase [Pseudomonadota bacterium]